MSTLLALPPAGYLGTAVVGRVDATLPALVGGAIVGALVGLAQLFALPPRTRARWTWVPATAALVSLGWTVTTLAGIDVDRQYISFGASGALVYGVLSGITLLALLPVTTSPRRTAAEGASRR